MGSGSSLVSVLYLISLYVILPHLLSWDPFGLTVICGSLSTKLFFVNFRAHQAIPQFPYHPGMAGMAGMAGLFYQDALGGCIT